MAKKKRKQDPARLRRVAAAKIKAGSKTLAKGISPISPA